LIVLVTKSSRVHHSTQKKKWTKLKPQSKMFIQKAQNIHQKKMNSDEEQLYLFSFCWFLFLRQQKNLFIPSFFYRIIAFHKCPKNCLWKIENYLFLEKNTCSLEKQKLWVLWVSFLNFWWAFWEAFRLGVIILGMRKHL
jgi:hypothetical protein